jgi:hypothetical protein
VELVEDWGKATILLAAEGSAALRYCSSMQHSDPLLGCWLSLGASAAVLARKVAPSSHKGAGLRIDVVPRASFLRLDESVGRIADLIP